VIFWNTIRTSTYDIVDSGRMEKRTPLHGGRRKLCIWKVLGVRCECIWKKDNDNICFVYNRYGKIWPEKRWILVREDATRSEKVGSMKNKMEASTRKVMD
jgi:hypothetical protein